MSGDSVSGATRLERRARLLLRAYPPDYRADRGGEILGTLLEAAPPGKTWPRARDAVTVLAAARRVRAAANQRQDPAAALRQVAALGIACFLATVAGGYLDGLAVDFWHPAAWHPTVAAGILLAAAIAVAWSGRQRLAAGVMMAAAVALVCVAVGYSTPFSPGVLLRQSLWIAPSLLSLAALGWLVGPDGRPPRSWLWLPGLPVAAGLATGLLNLAGTRYTADVAFSMLNSQAELHAVMVAAAIVWLITDVRPLAALALTFALMQVAPLIGAVTTPGQPSGSVVAELEASRSSLFWLAGSLVLALALAWRVRLLTASPSRLFTLLIYPAP